MKMRVKGFWAREMIKWKTYCEEKRTKGVGFGNGDVVVLAFYGILLCFYCLFAFVQGSGLMFAFAFPFFLICVCVGVCLLLFGFRGSVI